MTRAKKELKFVHLRVHSAYSLAEGAVRIDDFPVFCAKYNMPAVAITDSGNLFGALEFSQTCAKNGIQPIVGCVVEIENHGNIVLLVQNEAGYKNIIKLVSKSFLDGDDCHNPTLSLDDFIDYSDGLIALTGGADGVLGKPLKNGNISDAEKVLQKLKELFPDRLYIEIMRHGREAEKLTEKHFIEIAYKHDIPLVATNDVHFTTPDMFEAHDALICIAGGRYVTEVNRPTYTTEHYFKAQEEMLKLFADIPEALQNTVAIAKRCSFMPEAHAPMLPHFPTEGERSEEEELRDVAEKGLCNRLGIANSEDENYKKYFDRLDYELGVINHMEFPGYFLIVSDFIRWSKNNDIPVGPGRGSGAGSVVAWALEITDLDPLRFGLLFERFLNPERISMPDFDIDFCQYRRDEVIKYVQDKYGADKVAQIITFGKLQARAVLRDVGRVLQVPYGQVDKICKMIPFNALAPVTLSQAISMDPELKREQKSDEQVAKLLDIGLKLEGLYRHASTHAAGVVIGSKPLDEILPLYTDHKSPIPTTSFSMKYAEMTGLVKFDFLGLKTLTTISKACKLINSQNTNHIDINTLSLDDSATYKMLSEGSSTGVFQMESAGMRDALRKMKPDCIEDIIALISLYRPGPMENIPTYIARKHGKEKPDYLHPKLKECLKETFGVIIYQEQVMQIAQILAGYSLGGADLLRRAMGKKIKAEMDAQRDMFMEGAVKNGVDKQQAKSIFDLVAKFAGYGFNKSHAAAYAVIGYQTAYLKANYPVEFITASMNIDIGDTDKLNVFKEEAVESKIKILPPDINKSEAHFSVDGKSIRYGLGGLKNVGLSAMEEMLKEREKNGSFKDIFDFASRCDSKIINKRQIESLAKAGAFDSFNNNRKQLFEGATIITRYSQYAAEERESNQINLFGEEEEKEASKSLLPNTIPWSEEEKLINEFESIGFYLSAHPLDKYANELKRAGVKNSSELSSINNATIKIAGVPSRVVHRSAGAKRFSYLYLSDTLKTMEVSLFNEELISNHRELLEGKKPLLITAEIKSDEGGTRILAEKISLLDDFLQNRRYDIKVFLENTDGIKDIKNILQNQPKGMARIYIYIETPQKMNVEICLPNRYTITQEIFDKLRTIHKVAKIIAD